MTNTLQSSGIPGLGRPIQFPDKPTPPTLVSVLCFDGIVGNHEDHVSITGVSAGSACSIVSSPTGAHLTGIGGQSTHLKITPDPTGAVLRGHDFSSPGTVILHLYHLFAGEWPVEDDFNFFELHQNGNIIFALRVTNEGAGQAGLRVVDADGGMILVGSVDTIGRLTRHLFQVAFRNESLSDLVVEIDHVVQLTIGKLPNPDSATQLNFRDSAGGVITPYLKNAASSPTLETDTHCCGSYIRGGGKVLGASFFSDDIISTGQVVNIDSASAEFDMRGSQGGDILTSGSSGNFSDWNNATDATYKSNEGGLWAASLALGLTADAVRVGGVFNWLYAVDVFPSLGPATLRLHYGSVQEAPSNADIDFVEMPCVVISSAHAQVIVADDLSPLPAWDKQGLLGFEALGIDGENQVVRLIEALFVNVHEFPLATDSPLAGDALETSGKLFLDCPSAKLEIDRNGFRLIFSFVGKCTDCYRRRIIGIGVVNCACDDEGPDEAPFDKDWDLTPFQGENVGTPCGSWCIHGSGELGELGAVFLRGKVNCLGELEDLPNVFSCVHCHDGFVTLVSDPLRCN